MKTHVFTRFLTTLAAGLVVTGTSWAQAPAIPKTPPANASAKAAEAAEKAAARAKSGEAAAKASEAAKSAEKAQAAQKSSEKAEAAQKAAAKAESAQKAAAKAESAQKAAEKASAAQNAASKAESAQKAASKAESAQKAAEKASVAQNAAAKAESAQKAAAKAESAQKAAEKASVAQNAASKAESAQKAATKAESAQKAAEKASVAQKAAEKAEVATRAAAKTEGAQKAAAKAEVAQKAAEKAGVANLAVIKAEGAQKAAEKVSVAQASAEKASAATKTAEAASKGTPKTPRAEPPNSRQQPSSGISKTSPLDPRAANLAVATASDTVPPVKTPGQKQPANGSLISKADPAKREDKSEVSPQRTLDQEKPATVAASPSSNREKSPTLMDQLRGLFTGKQETAPIAEKGRTVFESQVQEEDNRPRTAPSPNQETRAAMSVEDLQAEQKGKSSKQESDDDIAAAYERLRRAESDEDDDPSYFRRQGNKDLERVVIFEGEQVGAGEEVKTALESGAKPEQVRQRVKDSVAVKGAAELTSVPDDDKDVRQAREDILKGKIRDPKAIDRKVKEIANKGIDQSFGEAPEVNVAELTKKGDAAKTPREARDFYDQAIDALRNGGKNSPEYRAKIIAEVDLGFRPKSDLRRVVKPGTSVGGLPVRTTPLPGGNPPPGGNPLPAVGGQPPATVVAVAPGSSNADPMNPRGKNPATSPPRSGSKGQTGGGGTSGNSGSSGGGSSSGSGGTPGYADPERTSRITGGDGGGSDAGQRRAKTGDAPTGSSSSGTAGTGAGAGSNPAGNPDGGDGGGGGGAGGGTGGGAGGGAGTGGGSGGGTGDGSSSGGGAGGSGSGSGTGGTPGGGNPDQPEGGDGNTGEKDNSGTGGGDTDGGTGDDSPSQEPTNYEYDDSGEGMTVETLPAGTTVETSTDPDSDQNYNGPFNSDVLNRNKAVRGAGQAGSEVNPVRGDQENPVFDRTIAVPKVKGGLLGNPGSSENVRPQPAVIDASGITPGNTQGNIDPAPDATPPN